MIRSMLPVLVLSLLAFTGGCRSSKATGELSKQDRATLAWGSQLWERAANEKDFATMAGLYSEDAILSPPNHDPVSGRAAIQEYLATFPPYADMQTSPAEVEGRGNLAYAWGGFTMTITLPGAGGPIMERGKYLEIWRKQPDGWWRISRDIFNSNLPAAGGPMPTTQPAK